MVEFPRIKKELLEFVSNEDGRISQESLIKLGIISVGALGLAQGVGAASGESGSVTWDYDSEKCENMQITCKNTIEGSGDVTMSIQSASTDPDTSMEIGEIDMNQCDEGRDSVRGWIKDKWNAEGGIEVENIDCYENCGTTDFPWHARFPLEYHQHENNLVLNSVEPTSIEAQHEHSIGSGCNVDLELKVDDCVDVHFKAEKDGTQLFTCTKSFG
jgi:hypothetical protein